MEHFDACMHQQPSAEQIAQVMNHRKLPGIIETVYGLQRMGALPDMMEAIENRAERSEVLAQRVMCARMLNVAMVLDRTS
jgi:hypothetical protein